MKRSIRKNLKFIGSRGRNLNEFNLYYNARNKKYYADPHPKITSTVPGPDTDECDESFVPKSLRVNYKKQKEALAIAKAQKELERMFKF